MADWTGFRIAPPCLLRASGEFVAADGSSADPATARTIVLCRSLCQFEAFPKRTGLEGRALARAARLHAQAHGPFAASDFALYRQPDGIAIWYWDRARVEAAIEGRRPYRTAAFTPEGAAPSVGDGAMLLGRFEGQEAQLWRSGTLLACLWRRRAFSPAQWHAFAGEDAPFPGERAVDAFGADHRGRIDAPLTWASVERIAWTGAVLGIAVAAFLAGQFLSVENSFRREEARAHRAQALDAAVSRDAVAVRTYSDAAPGFRHLLAAADALDSLDDLGASPSRWSVTETSFEASFDSLAADDLAAAVARLEKEVRLANVRARRETNGRGAVIVADVRRAPAGAS